MNAEREGKFSMFMSFRPQGEISLRWEPEISPCGRNDKKHTRSAICEPWQFRTEDWW